MNLNRSRNMSLLSILLLPSTAAMVLVIAGCSKPAHRLIEQPIAQQASAPMMSIVSEKRAEPTKADNTLAYTHDLSIEVAREHLQGQVNAVRDRCKATADRACTLLSISVEPASLMPSGSISMRLAPQGIEAMINLAASNAKIISNSTAAEDLAPELSDNSEKLKTLINYRDRLNTIMTKNNLNPDQLIAVAREQSNTQSQIEELTRDRSKLQQRIDTELLTIRFQVPPEDYSDQQSPVKDALSYFGKHFRDGLSVIITFVAYLLPWIPVLLLSFFGVRKLRAVIWKKPANKTSTLASRDE